MVMFVMVFVDYFLFFFFFKQKTAYEMRISDWSSDVCSSDLRFDNRLADIVAVAGMTGRMALRGPDAAGVAAQSRVAFGHRRLKIIDLSERAQQPMVEDRKSTRLNSSH